MKTEMTAAAYLPEKRSLPGLKTAARGCRGCLLYKNATQTVFGEGTSRAHLVLIGEQPGDREDLQGRPFVGPAGRILDEALIAAGLDRRRVYVTNAVKHFKWEARGPRRLHKKPSSRELAACRPWWEAELDAIDPAGIVCLGATAAQFVLGRDFRITRDRGKLQERRESAWVIATWHPSAVLRAPLPDDRRKRKDELIRDLKRARSLLSR